LIVTVCPQLKVSIDNPKRGKNNSTVMLRFAMANRSTVAKNSSRKKKPLHLAKVALYKRKVNKKKNTPNLVSILSSLVYQCGLFVS